MQRVIVFGGSGFVGRALCETLSAAGPVQLTVPTRRRAQARALWPMPAVQVVATPKLDDATLAGLLAGQDAAVNLVGILHGSAAEFDAAHARWPERLARACQAQGVPRLVHVSALGVDADHPEHSPSNYLRSKGAGERALREAGGGRATVLRPSVIHGADDHFLNLFASLAGLAPVLPLAGAESRMQPVWVTDVARAIQQCLQRPDTAGQTYEIAGPREYTLRELVQLAGRSQGHDPRIVALPQALAWLQAATLELMPGKPLMTRDNLMSLSVPNVASGRWPGLEELGIRPAALEDVAPWTLGRRNRLRQMDAWRSHRG